MSSCLLSVLRSGPRVGLAGAYEKTPPLLAEMKGKGFTPDLPCYHAVILGHGKTGEFFQSERLVVNPFALMSCPPFPYDVHCRAMGQLRLPAQLA
jgi:hypothetical protein